MGCSQWALLGALCLPPSVDSPSLSPSIKPSPSPSGVMFSPLYLTLKTCCICCANGAVQRFWDNSVFIKLFNSLFRIVTFGFDSCCSTQGTAIGPPWSLGVLKILFVLPPSQCRGKFRDLQNSLRNNLLCWYCGHARAQNVENFCESV